MRKLRHWIPILFLLFLLCTPALAAGEGNIDSGEGNMGAGTGTNYWNGEDGVRISVLDHRGGTVACFDWSNYNEDNVEMHFGKLNKLNYRHGYDLAIRYQSYHAYAPNDLIPEIVSSSGNDTDEIKGYFTDSGILTEIATQAGLTYEELISGEYTLLLEPIAYFVYNSVKYAMTAHEAALFDVQKSLDLARKMGRLTHQNLPLAMYLEESLPALSLYKPPSGFRNNRMQDNLTILQYLGVGIITFTAPPEPDEVPEPGEDYDYEFRCDTDVIVSFPIYSAAEITPDDQAYVTLTVGDTTYHRQFVCPAGETQLVWVRWHTPSTPQELIATATGAGSSVALRVKVNALEEKTPPDPTYYDTSNGFSLMETPDYGSCTRTTWGEWFAEWQQGQGEHFGGLNPVYGEENEEGEQKIIGWEEWYYTCAGDCKEHGDWDWTYVTYSARLTVTFELKPDDRCQTAYQSTHYGTVMGSGYGVQAKVQSRITRDAGVDSYDVTSVQHVLATFPEFGYQTYTRLLEKSPTAPYWVFWRNPCSYYKSRIHFTPLWYPDDTYYPVAFCVFDVWTPGGQLYVSGKDAVYIYLSCLDDWYIHLLPAEE